MDLSSGVIPESTPGKGNPGSKQSLWSLQHLILREAEEKEGKNKTHQENKEFLSNDCFTTTASPSSL